MSVEDKSRNRFSHDESFYWSQCFLGHLPSYMKEEMAETYRKAVKEADKILGFGMQEVKYYYIEDVLINKVIELEQ